MFQLSSDTFQVVLSYLNQNQVLSLRLVNKSFNREIIYESELFWETRLKSIEKEIISQHVKQYGKPPRKVFKNRAFETTHTYKDENMTRSYILFKIYRKQVVQRTAKLIQKKIEMDEPIMELLNEYYVGILQYRVDIYFQRQREVNFNLFDKIFKGNYLKFVEMWDFSNYYIKTGLIYMCRSFTINPRKKSPLYRYWKSNQKELSAQLIKKLWTIPNCTNYYSIHSYKVKAVFMYYNYPAKAMLCSETYKYRTFHELVTKHNFKPDRFFQYFDRTTVNSIKEMLKDDTKVYESKNLK